MDNRNLSASVLITVHNQAQDVREKLPAFLSQDGDSDYEVVVVNEMSTDDTPEALKKLKEDYPKLHTTFLPASNKIRERRKYALSIGLKASGYRWVMIADLQSAPPSEAFLQHTLQAMDEDADLTLGYLTKKGIRLQAFAYLDDARHHILKAERKLSRVSNRPRHSFLWGRYDFIIVKREQAYQLLGLFQQTVPFPALCQARLSIFFKNLFASTTTVSL